VGPLLVNGANSSAVTLTSTTTAAVVQITQAGALATSLFSVNGTACAAFASVSPAVVLAGSASTAQFSLLALANGSCAMVFSSSLGGSGTLNVTVGIVASSPSPSPTATPTALPSASPSPSSSASASPSSTPTPTPSQTAPPVIPG
jgi:hypothetical protein